MRISDRIGRDKIRCFFTYYKPTKKLSVETENGVKAEHSLDVEIDTQVSVCACTSDEESTTRVVNNAVLALLFFSIFITEVFLEILLLSPIFSSLVGARRVNKKQHDKKPSNQIGYQV